MLVQRWLWYFEISIWILASWCYHLHSSIHFICDRVSHYEIRILPSYFDKIYNTYSTEGRVFHTHSGITLGRALAPLANRNYVWRTLDPAGGHIGALLLETALKSVHSGPWKREREKRTIQIWVKATLICCTCIKAFFAPYCVNYNSQNQGRFKCIRSLFSYE